MFGFFKKRVSAADLGRGLWDYCCDASERSCQNYGPKLEAAGYLKSQKELDTFREEIIRLHLWMITRVYGVEFRDVLDVLHSYAYKSPSLGPEILTLRYMVYDKALAEDDERLKKNVFPIIGLTALQILVNKKTTAADGFISLELDFEIQAFMIATNRLKSEFKVKS